MEGVEVKSNVETLELYSDNYPFSLQLRMGNFDSEASYKKFIRNCEMLIRRSIEYKLWRGYIVDILRVNECAVTHESMNEVTIEVHHHIPSMFGLVKALVNKCIEDGEDFCSFDICTNAIELHFKNKVGYVTLLKSMHEKFHNGRLDIPINLIKGDYRRFISEYSNYLDEEDLETLQGRLAINETNCTWAKDNYPVAAEAR
ncbi:MAG: hypothetical protein ACTSVO_13575 [Candidatus Heimdallarchaeaceae archaeon]